MKRPTMTRAATRRRAPVTVMRRPRMAEPGETIAARIGWIILATAAGAGTAYALKRRRVRTLERDFDPDAELAASRIPHNAPD